MTIIKGVYINLYKVQKKQEISKKMVIALMAELVLNRRAVIFLHTGESVAFCTILDFRLIRTMFFVLFLFLEAYIIDKPNWMPKAVLAFFKRNLRLNVHLRNEKGGRIHAKRKTKNMRRKAGRTQSDDFFSGASAKGVKTEGKRAAEAEKRRGFTLPGPADGGAARQRGQAGGNFKRNLFLPRRSIKARKITAEAEKRRGFTLPGPADGGAARQRGQAGGNFKRNLFLPRRSIKARKIKVKLEAQLLKKSQLGAGIPDSVFFNGVCDKICAGFQLFNGISHRYTGSGCLNDFYIVHAVSKSNGIF